MDDLVRLAQATQTTAFLGRLGLGTDEEESFAPDSRYG